MIRNPSIKGINLGIHPEMYLLFSFGSFLNTCSGHFGIHHICGQSGDEVPDLQPRAARFCVFSGTNRREAG